LSLSLINLITSSIEVYVYTGKIGPNISSIIILDLTSGESIIVGGKNFSLASGLPNYIIIYPL